MKTSIFTERYLPNKPFASNNIKAGVRRYNRENALEKVFIETQPKTLKNFMVFDVDVEDAGMMIKSLAWDDGAIPEPNIITTNLASSHAHVIYFLDGVINSPRAISYYDSVRTRLQEKISGDTAYGSRIMRNPLKHATEYISDTEYKLSEIEAFVPDHIPYIANDELQVAAGRNDALFISLRKFGYNAYRKANYDVNKFYELIEAQAYFLNASSFDTPLTDKEVNSIVNSVYRWITVKHSKEGFSKIQSFRSNKRWNGFKEKRDAQVLELKDVKNMNFTQIGIEMNLTATAAKTAYYRAKKRA